MGIRTERDRERERYIYTYMHTYIHIYINILLADDLDPRESNDIRTTYVLTIYAFATFSLISSATSFDRGSTAPRCIVH